ncbi:SagB family peptide dehydrogenase [Kitasatospora sp. NPDC059571]|uniref:SagB/ThcOx family dehydrogenase n=1 Tax=Kitasatospora sp. NPDC059571 TaxID=3346871 RepID=UPI0036BFEE08
MTGYAAPTAAPGPARALWSLREDTWIESDTDGSLLHTRWGDVRIAGEDPAAHELLRRMALGPVALENLVPAAGGEDGRLGRARLMLLLERLRSVVVRSLALQDAEQPLLSAVPVSAAARFAPVRLPADRPLRLSRFASVRPGPDGLVLESPLSLYRLVFHRPEAMWVVSALGRPGTLAAVAAAVPLAPEVVREVVGHLAATGMAVVGEQVGDTPHFDEDADAVLATWSGRELLQHTRSRLGRHDDDFGATYSHVGRLAPEPALKPLPDGKRVPLERAAAAPADPPLGEVLAARRSVRQHGERPIGLAELGAFLDRVAAVRSVSAPTGADPTYYQTSRRPYPSGGAAYELEFYLTVSRCEGLADGVWYYDPAGHQLVLVDAPADDAEELLLGAQLAAGMDRPPQVLVTLTSRFQRLSWKYSAMWYALTLKHVGVVQQTMYLVATALGLAPCALGAGDIEVSARAFGLDWRRESSVGEFALGSLPAGARADRTPAGR